MSIQVHMRHVRNKPPYGAGLCVRGCRDWFNAKGLDFRDFLENGFPIEKVRSFNDAVADRVAEAAELEHADKSEVNNG